MSDLPLRDLTASEIDTYRTDGVVCARGLFPQLWVDRMRCAVDRAVAGPTSYGAEVSLKEKGFSGDLFLWKTLDDFRDFVYQSPAASIAAQVLGAARIRFFYDQLFVKPPGCHVATPWHHDITFWPISGEQVCSIWMTFDRVDRRSSGLEFVRGSHRWTRRFKAVTPDFNPYMMDSDLEDPPDIDDHRTDYDLVSWNMDPGDVLIFDGLVVHGSTGNHTTDRPRRAFSTRWAGDDIRFAPRHATMPLFWSHGLEPGDPLSGPLFPQVLPHVIASEGETRARGPEPPDRERVAAILDEIATAMRRRATETRKDT